MEFLSNLLNKYDLFFYNKIKYTAGQNTQIKIISSIIVVKRGKDCETISVQVLVRGCRCARITRPFAGDYWGGQCLATSSSQPDHRCALHVWLINFNWQQLKILSQQLNVLLISVSILIICELLFFLIRDNICDFPGLNNLKVIKIGEKNCIYS